MRPTPLASRAASLRGSRTHLAGRPNRLAPTARAKGPIDDGDETPPSSSTPPPLPPPPSWKAEAEGFASRVASIFDFEAWAPRSSRVWRLQVPPKGFEAAQATQAAADAAFVDGLNAALSGPGAAEARADARASVSGSDDDVEEADSGSDTDDASLAASLAARLAGSSGVSITPPTPLPLASADEEAAAAAGAAAAAAAAAPPLSGPELAALVRGKYGLPYDLTIVRRSLPGGIRVVALNVMWQYLGQRSLNLTPEGYGDKCDALATALSAWGCAGAVRAFFAEPARSKRGLPGRPVVGNAVSLRLDVDFDMVAEWMGGR